MRNAYLIFVGYAVAGFAFDRSLDSAIALLFIAASCSPLLLAHDEPTPPVVPRPPSAIFYWTIIALGVVNLWIIARNLERSLDDIFSIAGLAGVAASSTNERYVVRNTSSGNPILLALSLWLVFRVGAATHRMPKILVAIAAVPLVFYTLATTEKWPTYLIGVFFFAGVLLALPRRKASRTAVRYLAVVVPVTVLVSGLSIFFRGLLTNVSLIGYELLHDVLAPYAAFGRWLMHEASSSCCTFGGRSFVGTLDAMGAVVRVQGMWTRSTVIGAYETNIYTSFRYLIEDFSIVGPFLIASMLALGHIALRQLGSRTLAHVLAGFTLFAALLSVNVTPFVHNSTALAMVLSLASIPGMEVRVPTLTSLTVDDIRTAEQPD